MLVSFVPADLPVPVSKTHWGQGHCNSASLVKIGTGLVEIRSCPVDLPVPVGKNAVGTSLLKAQGPNVAATIETF